MHTSEAASAQCPLDDEVTKCVFSLCHSQLRLLSLLLGNGLSVLRLPRRRLLGRAIGWRGALHLPSGVIVQQVLYTGDIVMSLCRRRL